MTLLDADFRARLERLEVVLRKALPASLRGDRRAPRRKGISLEFADFRNYVPGDDVRHLDWAGYARLDQLMIKVYHDEEELEMRILVDESASMAYGATPKYRWARQLAAALAWIGIARGHRTSIALLGDRTEETGAMRSPDRFDEALNLLDAPPPSSRRGLAECCREVSSGGRHRGLVILISDLMEEAGPQTLLRHLLRPTVELDLIHVLAEEEITPQLEGDLALVDMESEAKVDVSPDAVILDLYRKRVRAFIADWAENSRRRGAAYAQASTAESLEDFVLRGLVQEGLLQ